MQNDPDEDDTFDRLRMTDLEYRTGKFFKHINEMIKLLNERAAGQENFKDEEIDED